MIKHQRRQIRLSHFDYSQPGAYFVTVCTEKRRYILGRVDGDIVHCTNAGQVASKWWNLLQDKFECILADEFIIMPNHIHGIIYIVGADQRVRPGWQNVEVETHADLPAIIQWYKTMTTNEYIRGVKSQGWEPFQGKFWQRNYYEHVIRDEDSLNKIREYIRTNPIRWELDRENLDSTGKDEFDVWLNSFKTSPGIRK